MNPKKELRASLLGEVLGQTREIFSLSPEEIVLSPEMESEALSVEEVAALAESIARIGLQEPLLVLPLGDGTYRLLAGFKRYFACLCLRLTRIPCCIPSGDGDAVSDEMMRIRQKTGEKVSRETKFKEKA